jgi:hypothetical protein
MTRARPDPPIAESRAILSRSALRDGSSSIPSEGADCAARAGLGGDAADEADDEDGAVARGSIVPDRERAGSGSAARTSCCWRCAYFTLDTVKSTMTHWSSARPGTSSPSMSSSGDSRASLRSPLMHPTAATLNPPTTSRPAPTSSFFFDCATHRSEAGTLRRAGGRSMSHRLAQRRCREHGSWLLGHGHGEPEDCILDENRIAAYRM